MDELRTLAAGIRLLVLDVDGVLTDGGLYYLDSGGYAVRFHVRDGMALAMARRAGLALGLVSGRPTPQVRRRAEELRIDEVHLDVRDKGAVLDEIIARRGLPKEAVAYVGDDLVDLPAMERVGLPIAVADAVEEVRAAARYVTRAAGGHGAVREVVDLLLRARGPAARE
ncbi:MAG: HAD-IIIA family hydrolase [Acidobacteriota bacterium]